MKILLYNDCVLWYSNRVRRQDAAQFGSHTSPRASPASAQYESLINAFTRTACTPPFPSYVVDLPCNTQSIPASNRLV